MNVRLVLVLVLAMAAPTVARAQSVWAPGVVIEKTAVRIDPTARVPLTTLARGTDVTVISVQDGWLEVAFEDERYGRRVGYVPRSAVNFAIPGARPVARSEPPKNPAAPVTPPVPPTAAPATARPVDARAAVAPATARPVDARAAVAAPSAAPPPPAAPAPRPPVRTVENEFPSATRSSSPAASAEPSPEPRARAVALVGDAFPAAGSPSPAAPPIVVPPSTAVIEPSERVAQPSATATVPPPEPAANRSSKSVPPIVAADSSRPKAPSSPAPIEATASNGARPPVSPKRGMELTLMIPWALLKQDGYLALRNVPIVSADITSAEGGGAMVNGVKEWMGAGLPSLLEASVKKITRNKDHTLLELRATDQGIDIAVKLRFAHSVPDPEGALGQLAVEGGPDTPAARKYRDEAYAAVASAVFAGDLRGLAEERKLSILATLQRAVGGPDVQLHDGRVYASYDLGVNDKAFDERTAGEETLIAHVMNETVLPEVRKMAKSLAGVPELHGMRVLYRIPHQAKRATGKEYRLELVADMSLVARFANSELTNQEFADASVLLVDGNGIRLAVEPESVAAAN